MKNQFQIAFRSGKFRGGFVIFVILLITMLVYPAVLPSDPLKTVTTIFTPPSKALPLGADSFGRNELVELIYGSLNSLLIGIIAGATATVIGLIIGLISGFVGGAVDNILSAVTNIFIVIPSFVILILISASISTRSYVTTALVIGFTSWPWTARAVRAQTTSLRNRDHVNLARMSGYSLPKIITFNILPYVASYVMMAFILQVSSGILSEAQLSMLGLGPTDVATLGQMFHWATQYEAYMSGAWWAFLPVILVISLITFSLNLMNTGLDQIFNPQLRG